MALQLLFQMSASLGLRWAWHFMCSHMLSSFAENFFSSGVGVTMKDDLTQDKGAMKKYSVFQWHMSHDG